VRSGLSAAEAQRLILGETPVLGREVLDTRAALGRVLADPVHSSRRLPPHDNSAMDGYAVRRADVADATLECPAALRVAFDVPAGAVAEKTLEAGQAARILTGASLPPGAEAVIRQEDTERDGDQLKVLVAPGLRENVRDAGEDVEVGEHVLDPGTVLGAAELGLLASLGRSVVSVHQRPRVAILSGGDELVEPDGDPAGGRIVASNSYSLAAHCRELGADPVYLGIARDTREDVEAHIRSGLRADAVVSSAGVSVGDHDHVRGVLESLGCELIFWGVQIKPGYPLAFGRFPGERGALVFGLPGNPVSAMVTFEQFARPALRKMMGFRSLYRPLLQARLAEELVKNPGRLHFVRVALEHRDGEVVASTTGNQSSGVLRSMTLAQGLLIFPAEADRLAAGSTASVQVLDPDFLAADHPGF